MPIRNNNRKKTMRVTTSQHETSAKVKTAPTEHNLPVREKIHQNKQHFGTR